MSKNILLAVSALALIGIAFLKSQDGYAASASTPSGGGGSGGNKTTPSGATSTTQYKPTGSGLSGSERYKEMSTHDLITEVVSPSRATSASDMAQRIREKEGPATPVLTTYDPLMVKVQGVGGSSWNVARPAADKTEAAVARIANLKYLKDTYGVLSPERYEQEVDKITSKYGVTEADTPTNKGTAGVNIKSSGLSSKDRIKMILSGQV